MQIHQLPAITTVPDSYMIPCDSGSANYYATVGNLTKSNPVMTLPNTQAITYSVDDLGNTARHYSAIIRSYGNQSTCAVPANTHFYVDINIADENYKDITLHSFSGSNVWIKVKSGGTWGNWRLLNGCLSIEPTMIATGFTRATVGCYLCGNTLQIKTIFQNGNAAQTFASDSPLFTIPGVRLPSSEFIYLMTNDQALSIKNSGTYDCSVYPMSSFTLEASAWMSGSGSAPVSSMTAWG